MGLYGGKNIDDITDIEELFAALVKRKHWNRIPQNILRQIVNNAKGDVKKVQGFRFISEHFGCVENNYVPIAANEREPHYTKS